MARHYDELDDFYRELWGDDVHHGLWLRGDEEPEEATANLTGLVAQRALDGRPLQEARICDVGCGYGGPARTLASDYGARVVGVTLSRRQARYAGERSSGAPGVHFLVADWLENPLPDGGFDAVVAVESASHMTDKPRFVAECRRVLAPGGRLVMAAWLAAQEPSEWAVSHLLEPICSEGRLPGLATASEYVAWMEDRDMEVVSVEDLTEEVRRTWSVCIRRVARRLLTDGRARRYLLDGRRTERVFALTLARIWLAYRVGALRYGVITARVR